MYVIQYDDGIYAGIYSDMDGSYIYPSSYFNRCKPKTFKTVKGVRNHLDKIKDTIVYGNSNDMYNFKIIEWTEDDLARHLKSIGVNNVQNTVSNVTSDLKLKKYWKKVFRPLEIKDSEITITSIEIDNNICTVSYLMPYSTTINEYFFQADLNKDLVIDGFCKEVEKRANEMIIMIRDCAKIRNLWE